MPGVRGPGPDADHAARRHRALERVALEPVVEQVADRHGHDPEEVLHVALAEAGSAAGLAQQREQVAGVAGAERRRRPQHHRAQEVAHPLEQRRERRVGVGVLARVGADRVDRLLLVVEEEQRRPVGRQRRVRRVERVDLVAELLQFEVVDHLRVQQGDDVGGARDPVAGPYLLGDAGAPEDVALLEHADAQTCLGEVRGCGKPVVTASDDDRVVGRVMSVGAHIDSTLHPS